MEPGDATPLKGTPGNDNVTSFRVIHPPPLQIDRVSTVYQQKPMRVQSASTKLWNPTTPVRTPLLDTSNKQSSSQTKKVPRPPQITPRSRPASAATLLVRLHDNPRMVIEAHFPQLVGCSTAAVLRELEDARLQAEVEGDLESAQQRTDMLRAFAEHAGRQAERGIATTAAHTAAVAEKAAHYRTLSFEFTKMWEETFRDYDEKAEQAVLELQMEQQRRYEEVESLIRSELACKRPHYSRKVISKREELDRLLAMRQYKEADRVRKDLAPLEESDESRFEESLNVTLASKTKSLRKAHEIKMEALRMRIAQGREELMLQRKTDYFNLILKHANSIEETQLTERRHAANERKSLHKQLNAMLIKSTTKPVHFESVLVGA